MNLAEDGLSYSYGSFFAHQKVRHQNLLSGFR
jgi:hypothetical protein